MRGRKATQAVRREMMLSALDAPPAAHHSADATKTPPPPVTIDRAALESIVDRAADSIIVADRASIIRSANPAAARSFGYRVSELIGRSIKDLVASAHHDRLAKLTALPPTPDEASRSAEPQEIIAVRNSGELFPADLSASTFGINGDRMIALTIRDISERRRLEREILEIGGHEQQRIGQDLHDGVCQDLTAITFSLESLRRRLISRSAADEAAVVSNLADLLRGTLAEIRDLSRGLCPLNIHVGSLGMALQDMAARLSVLCAIQCTAEVSEPIDVDAAEVPTHLYRIAQEATSNAIRHGRAKRIEITLTSSGDDVFLSINDNGSGLRMPTDANLGVGLKIMRYRANLIGGVLDIRPVKPHGTIVTCTLRRSSMRAEAPRTHG